MTTGSTRTRRPDVAGPRARDMSKPLPSSLSWTVLCVFATAFTVAYFAADLPLWIPALYLVMSAWSFAAYGVDKSAAKAGRRRVSEQALLTVGLVGGWPGSLIAQQVFRHKTRKRSFRRVFWFTVLINVAVLAGLVYVAVTEPGTLDLPFLTSVAAI
ncbi:DUF1294 domain-containing protein [Microbacterium sp. zg.Y1090]|uniref:DUF1294 domain-containing protein n=1 Tax=Microbacterium TaxID=33882 RepID=UPI00214CDE5D|nr:MULTISPECIES: DUF1294 domain-containing protein [unclassified Microbacterium]MCR2811945.1 DUF1294 domain-containing protein [Microbacterium sp. zg.Y1084]MCR2818616.1 DUF1294 domain-containing protein [Microbacterium sp. zg.Y1090]WIM29616.1 DUF1294 domain-containing protein [Microbacterium sp. zg-Y1090]